MIKSITFRNFFSLKDVTVELHNLSVLVGINGTGKSNFIKALRVLKTTIFEGALPDLMLNQWGGFDAIAYAGNADEGRKIELEFEFDEGALSVYGYHFLEPVYYRISFGKIASSQNYSISESYHTKNEDGTRKYWFFKMKNGKGYAREGLSNDQHSVAYQLADGTESLLSQLVDKDRYLQIYTLREAIRDISVYTYFDTTARSEIRKPMLPTGGSVRLLADGSNLPQILNRIKINSKQSFYPKVVEALRSVNPQFNGIDFNFLGSNIELLLDEKGLETAVHVTHISDGTLRYLCLLSILFNPQRGAVVCIDEPEVGLHPDMIGKIISTIKEYDSQTQFILSTHSEHILDDVSVDDILVCEKSTGNATIINTFREQEFVEWASQYTSGKLWRNGDIGGNRY